MIAAAVGRGGEPVPRSAFEHAQVDSGRGLRIALQHPLCVVLASTGVVASTIRQTTTPDRDVFVALDGRLDNRADLLGSTGLARVECSDADIIGALYVARGRSCITELLGDFVVVIWDAHECSFSCSTDFAGVKRVWWRETPTHVFLSGNMDDLFGPQHSKSIDEDYLSERLVTGWAGGRQAAFLGVNRLMPSESLIVDRHAMTVARYWTAEQFTPSDDPDSGHHVEQFRELLFDSVRARLPRSGPVWCDLSGGLDSSAITAIAAHLLGSEASDRLHAVTVAHVDASQTNELPWAEVVAKVTQATHHVIRLDSREPVFGGIAESWRYWDEPAFGVFGLSIAQQKHRLMECSGARILLNGTGAETVLAEGMRWPIFLAEHCWAGEWGRASAAIWNWHASRRIPLVNLVYHACVEPMVRPQAVVRPSPPNVMPWVTPEATRRWRARASARAVGHSRVSRQHVARAWCGELWRTVDTLMERGYATRAYETRYPFFHRPLVEAALRSPWAARVSPRQNKLLLRRALRGLLPDSIRRRRSFGADHAVYRALAVQQESMSRLCSRSVLAQLGLVDAAALKHALTLARHGHSPHFPLLITALALEVWTRSVLAGGKGDAAGSLATCGLGHGPLSPWSLHE